ncbi:hypothetical protein BDV93DRAFT_459345, partial [Ceratobasidium sp. AG-I]
IYIYCTVMHPSMRTLYLTVAGWDDEWIKTAVEIAERCWRNHYRPAASVELMAPSRSQFAYSKVSIWSSRIFVR